jgi:hypothetical protein
MASLLQAVIRITVGCNSRIIFRVMKTALATVISKIRVRSAHSTPADFNPAKEDEIYDPIPTDEQVIMSTSRRRDSETDTSCRLGSVVDVVDWAFPVGGAYMRSPW